MAAPAALAFFVACTPPPHAPSGWTVDTLPAGTIETKNMGQGVWLGSPPWHFAHLSAIGGIDSDTAAMFSDLADIAVDASGRVYVLDRKQAEIRAFTPQGTFVRTTGRFGHGPGELAGPQGLAFDPYDRLWVMNQSNGRYTIYDTAGTLIKEFPRPLSSVLFAGWSPLFTREGALYDFNWSFSSDSSGPRLVGGYARYDTLAGQMDPPLRLEWPEAPPLGLVIRASHVGWWTGSNVRYRLLLLSISGDTLRIISRDDIEPSASVSDISAQSPPPSPTYSPQSLPVPIAPPELHPVFANVIVDDESYLWVVRTPATARVPTTLDVFDPHGRFLGSLTVPYVLERHPLPIIRANRLFAVVRDDNDVPLVRVFTLSGRVAP